MRSEHKQISAAEEHKRYSNRRSSVQNHDEKPKPERDTRGDPPRGQARMGDGHHVTNRALGSEV